jgi:hypothetical protein
MVIEYITLMKSPPDVTEGIAKALRWLLGDPAPPDLVFGLVGHRFFKNIKVSLGFSSIEAQERYIERVRS